MAEAQPELAKAVQSEITQSIKQYRRWWHIWGMTASMVTILSILSSFAAGICAATKGNHHKFWPTVLAGFPALLLTFDQNFKFRARSDWFWNLVLRYQALQRALERGELTAKEASRKIDDIEDKADATDPTVTRSPNAPKSKIA